MRSALTGVRANTTTLPNSGCPLIATIYLGNQPKLHKASPIQGRGLHRALISNRFEVIPLLRISDVVAKLQSSLDTPFVIHHPGINHIT